MRRASLKLGSDSVISFGFRPVFLRVSLNRNISVETRGFIDRTIGQSNSNKLPNRAASNRSFKGRLGASFLTKRNMPTTTTTPKHGPTLGEAEGLPKLERQLTSTFDRAEMAARQQMDLSDEINHYVDDDPDDEGGDMTDGAAKMETEDTPAAVANLPLIFAPTLSVNLQFLTGEATDIGGGHENQDKSMCFRTGLNNEHLIMAVFDGHGKELGALAATVARDYMREELKKHEVLQELAKSPKAVLDQLFEAAHIKIKDSFRQRVEKSGQWEVFEAEGGYLIKRQHVAGSSKSLGKKDNYYHLIETNIHGGTTATVAIVLNSKRLIIANVGDSTALFGGVDGSGNVLYKELSAEHSPESIEEFTRVRKFHVEAPAVNSAKPNGSIKADKDGAALRFVYDVIERSATATPKHSCPPIFHYDNSSGQAKRVNENGFYYKNVRSEWATLVTTPPSARFQDALAFTRSLGDLHLHVYGVSHVPEVHEYDMKGLHEQVTVDDANSCSLLLVCTDGVWDNWKYEDIIRRVLSSSLISTTKHSDNAQNLTDEMMTENLRLARNYFGSQADNMTGVLCLIHAK